MINYKKEVLRILANGYKEGENIYQYLSYELKHDREIALFALLNNTSTVVYLPEAVCEDRKFMFDAVTKIAENKNWTPNTCGQLAFKHTCPTLHNDKLFAIHVLENRGDVLQFCKDIQDITNAHPGSEINALKAAAELDKENITYIPEEVLISKEAADAAKTMAKSMTPSSKTNTSTPKMKI